MAHKNGSLRRSKIGNQGGKLLQGELLEPRHLLTVGGTAIFVSPASPLAVAGGSVTVGDLDNDGDLDALVSSGSRNGGSSVLLNDGTGNFIDSGQQLGLGVSRAATLGDVDGDGDLDALITQFDPYGPGGNTGHQVWINDGSAGFSAGSSMQGDSYARAIELADLDGDGTLDAMIGYSYSPSRVWRNDGSGVFRDSGQSFGDSVLDIGLGDLDGDGDLDALLVDYLGGGDRVWLNDGNGVFNQADSVRLSSTGFVVAVGDFDGDLDLDAFIGTHGGSNQSAGNVLWVNDGQGGFVQGVLPDLGELVRAVEAGDLDGDGDLDLIVSDGYSLSRFTSVLLNDGNGEFTVSEHNFAHGDYHSGSDLGDLDGDGDLDLVTVGSGPEFSVWLNAEGDVGLEAEPIVTSLLPGASETVSWRITLTNEGGTDLTGVRLRESLAPIVSDAVLLSVEAAAGATTELSAGGVGSEIDDLVDLPAGAHVTYQLQATLSIPIDAGEVVLWHQATASLAGGQVDFRIANNGVDGRNIAGDGGVDQGTGLFVNGGDLSATNLRATAVIDFDGDGVLDLVGSSTAVLLGDGQGQFAHSERLVESASSNDVIAADFNGDALTDLLFIGLQDSGGRSDRLWFNQGAGVFTESANALPDSSYAAAGDVDADGDIDLLVQSEAIYVLENSGTGTFTSRLTSIDVAGLTTRGVALADLDTDGDLDAFAITDRQGHRVWNNEGNFLFVDSGLRLGNSRSRNLAMADVTGDGLIDAFVSDSGSNNVLWINRGQGNFEPAATQFMPGGSEAGLADVDGDGDRDVVSSQRIYLNDGAGQFLESSITIPDAAALNHWVDIEVADFDGDRDLDFLYSDGSVWLNADSELVVQVTPAATSLPVGVSAPISVDVTVFNRTSQENHEVNVAHSFSPLLDQLELAEILLSPNSSSTLSTGAIAGDSLNDLIDLPAGGSVTYRFTADASIPSPEAAAATWIGSAATAAGNSLEFNAANNASRAVNRVEAPFTGGTGALLPIRESFGGLTTTDFEVADMNGDGRLDLFFVGPNQGIWTQDEQGDFTPSALPGFGDGFGPLQLENLALADIDGDGDQDAVGAASVGVWLNDGAARFSGVPQDFRGAVDILLGDVNGDSLPDAVLIGDENVDHPGQRRFRGVCRPRAILGDASRQVRRSGRRRRRRRSRPGDR